MRKQKSPKTNFKLRRPDNFLELETKFKAVIHLVLRLSSSHLIQFNLCIGTNSRKEEKKKEFLELWQVIIISSKLSEHRD